MANQILKTKIIFVLICVTSFTNIFPIETLPLPGRVGNNNLYKAQFGNCCDIFFFMTPEKHELALDMIENVNENLSMTFAQGSPPCPTLELIIQSIKNPESDPKGKAILDSYAFQVFNILNNVFELKVESKIFYVNLNLNWEGIKIHQDRFAQQYDYIHSHYLSPKAYYLVQDLTLIDWEMSKGTISGTMVQDGSIGDRFILALFPNEVVGTFFAEPAFFNGLDFESQNSNRVTMPFHAAVPPMDYYSHKYPGSSKGKRMSTLARGISPNKYVELMKESAIELFLNRKTIESSGEKSTCTYGNGIVLKSLPGNIPSLNYECSRKYQDQENVEIIELSSNNNRLLTETLIDTFELESIDWENIQIFRVTKKDSGFSRFKHMNFDIHSHSKIILMNNSIIPKNYRYFNLAEDWTKNGLPWVQLYHFEPSMAMQISHDNFKKFALTPLEDLLFRDEVLDKNDDTPPQLMDKLVTCIDIFILPVKN